jgi:hypothetical protein
MLLGTLGGIPMDVPHDKLANKGELYKHFFIT